MGEGTAIENPTRAIKRLTSVFLYTRAGGRCEFPRCPKYLLEHDPTETAGNFAEQAHIYGFKEKAARGRTPGRPSEQQINDVENLILLCPTCHHLVDKVAPHKYPVEKLRRFKREHEARVLELTGIAKNEEVIPILVRGLICDRPAQISEDEMQAAAAPYHLRKRERIDIDLSNIPDQPGAAFWTTAASAIDRKIERLGDLRMSPEEGRRIAVFGVGPMPLLIHLGARLSDKMDIDLYQLHRNPKTLRWKEGEGEATYETSCPVTGEPGGDVALVVNLSGSITVDTLHAAGLEKQIPVHVLTLSNEAPHLGFLNTKDDLERFIEEYLQALARIRSSHPPTSKLHLFPAVPAPVAIAIGLHRLPKVDPSLVVYDRDKRAGIFNRALEIT